MRILRSICVSRLPPLITQTIVLPASSDRRFHAAAIGAAPAPSARLCVARRASARHPRALPRSASRCPSDRRFRMPKGRSKVTRVAMPSAKVSAESPTTRPGPRHERANASARSACTPMMSAFAPSPSRTVTRPLAPLPPPIGTNTASASGSASKISSA